MIWSKHSIVETCFSQQSDPRRTKLCFMSLSGTFFCRFSSIDSTERSASIRSTSSVDRIQALTPPPRKCKFGTLFTIQLQLFKTLWRISSLWSLCWPFAISIINVHVTIAANGGHSLLCTMTLSMSFCKSPQCLPKLNAISLVLHYMYTHCPTQIAQQRRTTRHLSGKVLRWVCSRCYPRGPRSLHVVESESFFRSINSAVSDAVERSCIQDYPEAFCTFAP